MGFWEDNNGGWKSWSTEDSSSAMFKFCKRELLSIEKKIVDSKRKKRYCIRTRIEAGRADRVSTHFLIVFSFAFERVIFSSEVERKLEPFSFSGIFFFGMMITPVQVIKIIGTQKKKKKHQNQN